MCGAGQCFLPALRAGRDKSAPMGLFELRATAMIVGPPARFGFTQDTFLVDTGFEPALPCP